MMVMVAGGRLLVGIGDGEREAWMLLPRWECR